MLTAAPSVTQRPWRQALWIAGIAGSAYVLVALATYHHDDLSLSVSGTGKVENFAGPVGATVADVLYQSVGYASWAFVLVAGWCARRLAGRPVAGLMSAILGGSGMLLLAAAFQLTFGGVEARAFPPGGVAGILLADALGRRLGHAGAALGVFTGLLTVATLLFRINWQPLASRAVDRIQAGAPAAVRAVGAGALRVSARIGGAGVSAIRERFAPAPEDEDYEDEEEPPAAGAPAPPPPPGPAGNPVRVAGKVRAPPLGLEDHDAALPSVWSARAAPAVPAREVPVGDPDRDVPTKVAGRTLVEVEWDADTGARPGPSGIPSRVAARERATSSRPGLASAPPFVAPSVVAPSVVAPSVVAPSVVAPPFVAPPFVAPPFVAPPFVPAGPDAPASFDAAPSTPDPIVQPDDVAAAPRPAARPPRRAPSSGAAVLPGNLRSGGAGDDGHAIRATTTPFKLPPLSLLDDHPAIVAGTDEAVLHEMARKLAQTLRDFDVEGRVTAIRPGPVITMFEFEPAPGVKLSKIEGLADNLKMNMKAFSVRIVAPIPGRGCVGIEIPNERRQTVWARDVFASPEFTGSERALPMILGKDTEGRPFVTDLAKMPHLLVGGTTGSGKSVGLNAMLVSMMYMRTPEELRMILIDPKMLELALYEDIPHLLHPVVTEPKMASSVLKWACTEMDDRYRIMARWQTRHIDTYNQKVDRESVDWNPVKARQYAPKDWPEGELVPYPRRFPYIVIVIDELADLMMVASSDVETSVARIAQKARAAGIHLIVATQTPRRDVVTGTIKANMPASLAYQVRSGLDSRVILDQMGAETLLGKGDLLFLQPGTSHVVRVHGPFITEDEVHRVADFLRAQGTPEYDTRIASEVAGDMDEVEVEHDEKYDEAVQLAAEKGKISTSMIQRHLGIGYNRAASIVEMMEREGVVGPADGVKPREVLVGRG